MGAKTPHIYFHAPAGRFKEIKVHVVIYTAKTGNGKGWVFPPFYMVLILFSILGLGYMMLSGISPHDSIPLISVSLIYGFLFLCSLGFVVYFFWKYKISETLTRSAMGLVAGMLVWTGLLALQSRFASGMSLTFPAQTIFSAIVGQIPPFYNFMMVNIWSPVIEEMFFGIAIPVLVIVIFNAMSKSFPLLGNKIIQIVTILFLASTTFAYFHTSATTGAFFIAAMMFRTVHILLLHGDRLFDLIPKISISFAFIVGAHIANNLYVYGLKAAYALLMSEPEGQVTLLIFGVMLVMAARGLFTGGK